MAKQASTPIEKTASPKTRPETRPEAPPKMQAATQPEAQLRRSFWMFWILLIGFAFRSYLLTEKPVHFDEGINGHFVQTIWRDGFYRYDPTNFHGPLFFYILALAERVFGFGIFGFRIATALLNLTAILIVGMHRRFIGNAAIYAAFILALSTGMVFYGRYAIHESLFTLSQVAFSYGFFLYRQEKSNRSLWWLAAGLVGLITTKETFVIFLGTWATAVAVVSYFETLVPAYGKEPKNTAPPPAAQNWIAIAMVAGVIVGALFTGFFLNLHGAVDMLNALQVWTHTATAHTGHEKPFLYWSELLTKYEWPCLIGLLATPFVFFSMPSTRALRTLVLFAFGTWLAYSLIPYKTPWLVMSILWPLSFSAGAVIARVVPSFRYWRGLRTGFAILTFATLFFSAREMIRVTFHDYAKINEPYVYVQSTKDMKFAIDTIFAHIKREPRDLNLKLYAMSRDPWPLPYLLEPLPHAMWGHDQATDLKDADVVLTDEQDVPLVVQRLSGQYYFLPFQLRDSYQAGQAFYRASMFKDDLPTGTVAIEGGKP